MLAFLRRNSFPPGFGLYKYFYHNEIFRLKAGCVLLTQLPPKGRMRGWLLTLSEAAFFLLRAEETKLAMPPMRALTPATASTVDTVLSLPLLEEGVPKGLMSTSYVAPANASKPTPPPSKSHPAFFCDRLFSK